MEDVIWFLVNYPVFLLLVMNICAYWKRDRVTEALAKVIDSRKRIKIDILKAIAGAADALYDIYRENQVPGRRRKLLKDMERIFDETHNADVANALAILEANEHTIYGINAIVADIYNVAAAYDNSLTDTQKILLRQSR